MPDHVHLFYSFNIAELDMQAIILDTETHTLNGQPIEIAYAPIQVSNAKITLDKSKIFGGHYG